MARPDRAPPRAVRLPPVIDRADVPAVVERCGEAMSAEPGAVVPCDAGAVSDPRLAEIETIARLALLAHRGRRRLLLEHASPALLDLLAFCGLTLRVEADDPADVEAASRARAGDG